MCFKMGQAVLGKVIFTDGFMPKYARPYLIVDVKEESVSVLNVSSLKGKEWKLAYPSNVQITKFSPPFKLPSFAKLDSLSEISIDECKNMRLLDGGKTLDEQELSKILELLNEYEK